MKKFTLLIAIAHLCFINLVLAAGHSGQAVSDLENLPVRSGDWTQEEIAKGREQLVRAFDAAWIRVIASGKDREIVMSEPLNQPGAAQFYITKLVDCLPTPELAEWPKNPVGPFKDILETGIIRQLVQGVPDSPTNTTWYFSGVSQKYKDAIFTEISNHYNVDIKIESVVVPPGDLPATYLLVDNKIDFISQINALGGITQDLRRRISRRFSCTMNASGQFIHIPKESELVNKIKTFNDLIARPDVKICSGPLSTQMAEAFMPNHTVHTRFVDDLTSCDQNIAKGKYDVMMNPIHDLSITGIDGYISVSTPLVAGTPLWVALEGIECNSDGKWETEPENQNSDNACFETEKF
ncbi:MAG: hypothetical protein VYA80_08165 [Pseudomonadota bacterium]|nr:hypothetical protein [Pseudomonadota bacterium]